MSSTTVMGCFILTIVLLFQIALAEDTTNAEDKKDVVKHTSTSTSGSSSDLFLPSNILSMLATGGSVAAGVVLVAAVGVLILQVFGIRFCQLMGTCEPQYQGYSNNAYDAYGPMHSQAASYPAATPTAYQKRSLEYVGPILTALKTAYDKYGVPHEAPVLTTE